MENGNSIMIVHFGMLYYNLNKFLLLVTSINKNFSFHNNNVPNQIFL